MRINAAIQDFDLSTINVSDYWSSEGAKEIKMHKIHAYAAKFPSFVVSKSIKYAKDRGFNPEKIGDIFCGCGTTALEARRNNLNFWGCDINPVATLIAKVKSQLYDQKELSYYYLIIKNSFKEYFCTTPEYIAAHERLNYWFDHKTIDNLHKLLTIIRKEVPNGKYQDFFLVAFSNILKSTSRWLTKSIKPQVDPNKVPTDVEVAFDKQYRFMFKANNEAIDDYHAISGTEIVTHNFLDLEITKPILDLLVTSPPYVTSYEYADLHQLSTLWLGFTNDYRALREGTIGSLHHSKNIESQIENLNEYAKKVYNKLHSLDKSKARSVAKYFLDMRRIISKSFSLLREGSLSFIVIGNTQYKGVEINNAKYIIQCMQEVGFINIDIAKRKIGSKNLTPYRDARGKFTKSNSDLNIYSHEFVVIGEK